MGVRPGPPRRVSAEERIRYESELTVLRSGIRLACFTAMALTAMLVP